MGPVAFGVSRRLRLCRLVHQPSDVGFVAVEIGASADNLAVAGGGREVRGGDARALPSGGDRADTQVREAGALGPDPGVKDADNDVVSVVGVGPEAEGVGEAQEVGGVSGVELTWLVGRDGEYGRVAEELCGLRGSEGGGEAVDGEVVGVEELGGVRGREILDDGGVPAPVGGEEGGLLGFGHVDDEGFWAVGQVGRD